MSTLETIRTGEVNAVGELLRAATFPEHNPNGDEHEWAIGAYTTFLIREDAYRWSEESVKAFFDYYWEDVDGQGYSFDLDGLRVDMARFYEGDSVLVYIVWSGDELIRALENTDAKKNYVWKDLSVGDVDHFRTIRDSLPVVHLPLLELDRSPRSRPSQLAERLS